MVIKKFFLWKLFSSKENIVSNLKYEFSRARDCKQDSSMNASRGSWQVAWFLQNFQIISLKQ